MMSAARLSPPGILLSAGFSIEIKPLARMSRPRSTA